MLKSIKGLVLVTCLLPTPLLADFAVQWQPARDGSEELFAGALRDSRIINDAAKLDELQLNWPDALTLSMGGAGLPRYDSDARSIHLPYSYLALAVRTQYNFEESRAAALQRGLDVVEYTIYHLLGHALIDDHSVDFDEEAEKISTFLMTTSFSNGGEQWLDDIVAFGRASQKLDGPLEDYWHDHGLSKRAAQRLNCIVIGSDPQRYVERFPGLVEAADKSAACQKEWVELKDMIDNKYRLTSD